MTVQTLVTGYPLTASLSPALHNRVYRRLGIAAHMTKFAHLSVDAVIQRIRAEAIPLTAVTMPFKEKIMAHLDKIMPQARAAGAINTIINAQGRLLGYNTDIDGITYALRNFPLRGCRVLLAGAGGAARAAALVLKNAGAMIYWQNRTHAHAQAAATQFGGEVISPDDRQRWLEVTDSVALVINATPAGMMTETAGSALPAFRFRRGQTLFDMVYHYRETPLAKMAMYAGAAYLSGMEMFLAQGLRQIQLWTGQEIQLTATLKNTLTAELHRVMQHSAA